MLFTVCSGSEGKRNGRVASCDKEIWPRRAGRVHKPNPQSRAPDGLLLITCLPGEHTCCVIRTTELSEISLIKWTSSIRTQGVMVNVEGCHVRKAGNQGGEGNAREREIVRWSGLWAAKPLLLARQAALVRSFLNSCTNPNQTPIRRHHHGQMTVLTVLRTHERKRLPPLSSARVLPSGQICRVTF